MLSKRTSSHAVPDVSYKLIIIYLLLEGYGPCIEVPIFSLTSFLLTQILHYNTHYIGLLSYTAFLPPPILYFGFLKFKQQLLHALFYPFGGIKSHFENVALSFVSQLRNN